MKVKKDEILGTYTIVGLDSDQLAYITGLIGISNSGLAGMPTTKLLYDPLFRAAKDFGLVPAVHAAGNTQWQWLRREAGREKRERVA